MPLKEKEMRQSKGLAKRSNGQKLLKKSKINKGDNLKFNLLKRFTKISMITVVFLALILKVYFYFINAPFFAIDDPIILGINKLVLIEEVSKKVNQYFKKYLHSKSPNIFKINLRELSSYLQTQFTVAKEIIIERKLPNKLIIRVIEKEIIAFINTDYGMISVDKDGYVFLSNFTKRKDNDYPIITGVKFSKIRLERKIEDPGVKKAFKLINRIKSIDPDSLDEFSEFNINSLSQIEAYTISQGTKIYFGQDISLDLVKKLLAIISYLKQKEALVDYVDLRFKNIVVKFKNS